MSIESVPSGTNPLESYQDTRASHLMQTLVETNELFKHATNDAERHELCAILDKLFSAADGTQFQISGRVRYDSVPENGISLMYKFGQASKDVSSRYYDVHEHPLTVNGSTIEVDERADKQHLALLITDPIDEGTDDESVYYARIDELFGVVPMYVTAEIAKQRLALILPDLLQKIEDLPSGEASKQTIVDALKQVEIRLDPASFDGHPLASYLEVFLNDRFKFNEIGVKAKIGELMFTHNKEGEVLPMDLVSPATIDAYLGSIFVEEITTNEGHHRFVPFFTLHVPYGNRMGDYHSLIIPVGSVIELEDAPPHVTFIPREAFVFSRYEDDEPLTLPQNAGESEGAIARIYQDRTEPRSYNQELRIVLEECDVALQHMLAELAALPQPPIAEREDDDSDDAGPLHDYQEAAEEICNQFMATYGSLLGEYSLEVSGPGVAVPDIDIQRGQDEHTGEPMIHFRQKGNGVRRDAFSSHKGNFYTIITKPKLHADGTRTMAACMALTSDPHKLNFTDEEEQIISVINATDVFYADLDGSVSVTIPDLEQLRERERVYYDARRKFMAHPELSPYIDTLYDAVEDEDPKQFHPIDIRAMINLFAKAKRTPELLTQVGDTVEGILGPHRMFQFRADVVTEDSDGDVRYAIDELPEMVAMQLSYILPSHPRLDTGPVLVGDMNGQVIYAVIETLQDFRI